MSSKNPDNDDSDDLKGVPKWKIDCMIVFFNVLLFPVYLINKYIIDDVDKEDKKDDKK